MILAPPDTAAQDGCPGPPPFRFGADRGPTGLFTTRSPMRCTDTLRSEGISQSECGPGALKNTKHSTYEHSLSCDLTSLLKRHAFFIDRSSSKAMFYHHSHIVCDYNQVWRVKMTSEYAPGVAEKKIGERIASS
ncbi:hypothetical protein EVAR_42796_1 [Eumeta japonica]|uniref:Uncharacterized protein n=1 Tax=Eumeta variegata TaxID=151549 RepID=A0A4C1WM96_EUMVA|nr:hypothetical protein EVAR_42796_1 [Eumeta japonica]